MAGAAFISRTQETRTQETRSFTSLLYYEYMPWSVMLAGVMEPYDAEVSRVLEAAWQKNDSDVLVTIRGAHYRIDFATSRQIAVTDPTKQRSVQRSAPPQARAAATPSPATAAPAPAATVKRKLPDFAKGFGSPLTEPRAEEPTKKAKEDVTTAIASSPGGAGPSQLPAGGTGNKGGADGKAALRPQRISKPKEWEYVGVDDHRDVLTPTAIRSALTHLAQFDELSGLVQAANAEMLFERESMRQAFARMCDSRLRQGQSMVEGDAIVRDVKRRAGGVWSPDAVVSNEAAMRGHTNCTARLGRIGTCIELAKLLTADPPPDFEGMCDADVLRSSLHDINGIGEHTMRKFLLWTLGRSDVLLSDKDGAVNTWLEQHHEIPRDGMTALVERQRLDVTQGWRPWRSVASLLILANANAVQAPTAAPAPPKAPRAKKFVGSSNLCAAVDDVPRLPVPDALRVECLHTVVGEQVVVIRNALSAAGANELLRQVVHLSGSFPVPGDGTENGRGRVCFPMELITLLHAETRMVLRSASAALHTSGDVNASSELAELAERPYTSVCGGFLYDQAACLRLHLDDVAACNSNPYDPRVTLWNFGNDCNFKWVPAITTARTMWKTRDFDRKGSERIVTLHHGDALIINVEKIAHGVKVLASTADADAKRLLGDRRICVPIRPMADDEYAREHAAFRGGR